MYLREPTWKQGCVEQWGTGAQTHFNKETADLDWQWTCFLFCRRKEMCNLNLYDGCHTHLPMSLEQIHNLTDFGKYRAVTLFCDNKCKNMPYVICHCNTCKLASLANAQWSLHAIHSYLSGERLIMLKVWRFVYVHWATRLTPFNHHVQTDAYLLVCFL